MRTPALALLALLALGAASTGVNGAWSFKTEPFDGGCVMTGDMIVKPADSKGLHVCAIKTHEKCPNIVGDAVENCTLDENSGAVTITSTVISIKGPPGTTYYPDNFALKFENDSRMAGYLRSRGGDAPVVFYRGPAVVS